MVNLIKADIRAIRTGLKPDFDTLEKRLNGNIAASEKRVKEEIVRSVKGDMVTFKDEILKEIQDLRADVAITTGYRDMIEDHDQRIEVLEKSARIATP